MFFILGSVKGFCSVWAIGGSEMLVGTVMLSGVKVYVIMKKFGIQKQF